MNTQFDQPRSGVHFLLISKFVQLMELYNLTLPRAWSLSIGRLPHFSRDTRLATKPAIVEHIESSAWIPYTDDGKSPYLRQVLILINHRSTIGAVMDSAIKRPQRLQNVLRALRDRPQVSLYIILPWDARNQQVPPRNIHQVPQLVRRNPNNTPTREKLHASRSICTVSSATLS